MDRKGFTLIEVLMALAIIGILATVSFRYLSSSMSLGKKESYRLMKNNIVSAGYNYLSECKQQLVSCDLNEDSFKASELEKSGYFKDLTSPIDGKYLGDCLTLKTTSDNGVMVIDIIDECYR